jgi:hypothetical protein
MQSTKLPSSNSILYVPSQHVDTFAGAFVDAFVNCFVDRFVSTEDLSSTEGVGLVVGFIASAVSFAVGFVVGLKGFKVD